MTESKKKQAKKTAKPAAKKTAPKEKKAPAKKVAAPKQMAQKKPDAKVKKDLGKPRPEPKEPKRDDGGKPVFPPAEKAAEPAATVEKKVMPKKNLHPGKMSANEYLVGVLKKQSLTRPKAFLKLMAYWELNPETDPKRHQHHVTSDYVLRDAEKWNRPLGFKLANEGLLCEVEDGAARGEEKYHIREMTAGEAKMFKKFLAALETEKPATYKERTELLMRLFPEMGLRTKAYAKKKGEEAAEVAPEAPAPAADAPPKE